MKILVIEDEEAIREIETAYLNTAGFETIGLEDGKDALNIILQNNINLVILDVNLPYINGMELCKAIRKRINIPIIIVTARIEDVDEMKGFELGADDYIKKPFNPNILVARVKNMLKRMGE